MLGGPGRAHLMWDNHNGSEADCGGICDASGEFRLMPHPGDSGVERHPFCDEIG